MKLNQYEINSLDRSMTRNEIETVIKVLSTETSPGPDRFTAEFYQTFRKFTPALSKFFLKEKMKDSFQTLLYEASITLIPNPDKDNTKKQKNYRPISQVKKYAKVFNKILANPNLCAYKQYHPSLPSLVSF